jgi:hypothetical protein
VTVTPMPSRFPVSRMRDPRNVGSARPSALHRAWVLVFLSTYARTGN